MPVTYVHGSRFSIVVFSFLLICISIFFGLLIAEKKIDLKKNIKEYELISSEIVKKNQEVIKENNL